MTYTLDYFVAILKCPHCGTVSLADDSTNMATYIRDQPELTYLGVGHSLTIRSEEMQERGYLQVQAIQPGKPIRLLHPWECPTCGRSNWAEIVIQNGVITDISVAILNQTMLDHIHFIHDESKGVAAVLSERSYLDISDEDVVPILRKHL